MSKISLTPEQEAWFKAQVAAGAFASVEEAAHHLIENAIFAQELQGDDLAWVEPLLDEARADLARGDTITLEDFKRENAPRIAPLRGRARSRA